jgi:DNA topoisomerase-1
MAKKKTSKKTGSKKKPSGSGPSAAGKRLVIVESPAKAKTINRYLGPDYVVKASVGHVRDLPAKNPKGVKDPVPGVDLEKRFTPTYKVLEGKSKTVTDLKKAAKSASEIWFATDLDREGEAIAWHLAELLGIDPDGAKRVVFNAITKSEIERAFSHPHEIDMNKVDAQQARRILDRIVGYQVSPLLWKKVARGLSAGRVQSVAVRLVVEREREIRAFVPDESWKMTARFALDASDAPGLVDAWRAFIGSRDDKGAPPTAKAQNGWLSDHAAIRAELVRVGGKPLDVSQAGVVASQTNGQLVQKTTAAEPDDLTPRVVELAERAGLTDVRTEVEEDEGGKGPSRYRRRVWGDADPSVPYRIASIETKRTRSRPSPPFITSTLQQAASTRLGFGAQRTMRAAQRLYEGVEIPGEGSVGLITYMRTDSTHLTNEAIDEARSYIGREFGQAYLPDKPSRFSSSNKDAQEAHEAIRPTSLAYPPSRVKSALKTDEFRLYELIWKRFVACQMTAAEWDSTTVTIEGGRDPEAPLEFRASGRVLAFDGFLRVAGVPRESDEQTLPAIEEGQAIGPFSLDPEQKFSSPPPRYTEASLIKTLESEGIGRPSTYASIIQVIQDRKYVEQLERRFYATDLGEVVTDKLIEAFPSLMGLDYTRRMESELDKIEDEHKDWVSVLDEFYHEFSDRLERAHEELAHAKAETQPAPKEYRCEKCGSDLVYRFGKNGRFLSCSNYPSCNYACPIDREGRPRMAEYVDIRCPKTGRPMVRKSGRFGPFVTTVLEEGESPDVGIILNIDKKGFVTAPSPPALETDLPCPKCESPLNLRDGVRGPWLGCSRFPKCRGRGKWAGLEEAQRAALEKALAAHLAEHPIPVIETLDGRPLTDAKGKPLPDAPPVEALRLDEAPRGLAATG